MAVLRDAEGLVTNASALVENAGLLSDPPAVSPIAGSSWQGRSEDATTPPGDTGEAAASPSAEVAPVASVVEDDEHPDPRFLEGPPAREPLPAPPAGPAENEIELVQGAAEPGDAALGTGTPSEAPAEGASEQDQSLAFDERALDSFFSEQDLGDQRSTSRFRRRQ